MFPNNQQISVHTISAAELRVLNDDAALLDVREIGEYEAGHIVGATTLPRSRLEFDALRIVPDLSACVVLYDGDDGRGNLAFRTLASMGYRNLSVLKGGVPAWIASGGKIISGTNVPSKIFGEKLLHEHAIPEIMPLELAQLVRRSPAPLILDVRTYEEHKRGCIPGAVHVPGGELITIAGDIRRLNRPVITHCAGRTRGLVAAATLNTLGVADARALHNGTMGWQLAGLDLEIPTEDRVIPVSATSLHEAVDAARQLAASKNVPTVNADWLMNKMHQSSPQPLYVFDVRTEKEYAALHIFKSIHVAGGQLIQRADDYIGLQHADIVLVSGAGTRATMAAWWLMRMGFRNVAALAGGLANWKASGGESEQSSGHDSQIEAAVAPIAAQEVMRLIEKRLCVVLDLGTSIRYERRHLPTAHWLSRGWLEITVPARLPDTTAPLVLTGAEPAPANLAATALQNLGYGNVRILDISVNEWHRNGYPIEQGLEGCWNEPCDVPNLAILKGDRDAMRRYLAWETALDGPTTPSLIM